MTSTSETRPKWTFKIQEELARWLWGHPVTKITHHWKFTGVDTSEEWLELHSEKQKRILSDISLPRGVTFSPNHAGLLRLDESIAALLREIDSWEKKHERDLAEYDRLKRLFGDASTPPAS